MARESTEQARQHVLMRLRWPNGFRCPQCGSGGALNVDRQMIQCSRCATQTYLRAGTIMGGSHLPLETWFRAARIVKKSRDVSATQLQRHLGLSRWETAAILLKKLRASSRSRANILLGHPRMKPGVNALAHAITAAVVRALERRKRGA